MIEPSVASAAGRIVKNTGDGFLACFESVLAAFECASQIQSAVNRREADQPSERRIGFRMRLQEMADPGGLAISASVREQLGSRLKLPTIDLGNVALRNIAGTARVYRVL